ncbi:NitT/TauT family transport system substrate-binding protein [Mariprofundus ferrinatatus]|uniref:NitT/TauT family transport system substrate-binding protein n=1 Tax=Mariprofundus ferrinatatus TaxID=1921087 RepID=A0A2K8LC36_9PROT|nr:ABC transporter substrate-binding protein [Mariprofundus ferrinatatus]ATX81826.1 NitT/TauT family transport system substrate-binding protein [Mariprofundus ferrinatatus]
MKMKSVWIGLAAVAAVIAAVMFFSGGIAEKGDVRQGVPLAVGTNIWPGYEPLYLARELGYYDGKGVRLIEFASATQVLHAFRNKVIAAAALTLDEVLLLKDYGLDPRVVLVFDTSDGADVILSKREFSDMKALKGKRIGVENTALGAFMLMRALQLNGMQLSDVEIVSLPINEHDTAFKTGKVDALVTFDPVRSRLMAEGYHELFTSKDIPDEVVDVLVVSEESLLSHNKELNALFSGWFRGLDYLDDYPEKAAGIMAARQKISTAELLEAYKGLHLPDLDENISMMDPPPSPLYLTATRMSELMYKSKLLKSRLNLKQMIAVEPLKQFKQGDAQR